VKEGVNFFALTRVASLLAFFERGLNVVVGGVVTEIKWWVLVFPPKIQIHNPEIQNISYERNEDEVW
jgi:hypothetical protein